MKILVSNDDGIDSKGIYILANKLKELGEVTVVAPHVEQSAVGHAITMKIPLRVKERIINNEVFGYSVTGTPADCVKMGVRNILKDTPDIVISGINHGSNTASNVIYSGTVAAAREAAMMNIPSIAVSIADHNPKFFDYAAEVTSKLAKLVVENGLQSDTLLNINVPNLPKDEIKGIKFTRMGKSRWDDVYEKRVDPYGSDYYWLTGKLLEHDKTLEYDQFAVSQGYISISPIHFDLTDYETLNKIKDWKL